MLVDVVRAFVAIAFVVPALGRVHGPIARNVESLERRSGRVIADGTKVEHGKLPNWDFTYYASGEIILGGCPSTVGISSTHCYQLLLPETGDIIPGSLGSGAGGGEQQVLLTSPSYKADGVVQQFIFKIYVDDELENTPDTSLPLVQILSSVAPPGTDGTTGPTTPVWMSLGDNLASIFAFSDDDVPTFSVPLTKFTGRTTLHNWVVKGGTNGGFAHITILDDETRETIIHYEASGTVAFHSYNMVFGMDRGLEPGKDTPFKAYFGDLTIKTF